MGELREPNLYSHTMSSPVNSMDFIGLWTITWTWNPDSHGSGKWASMEGHLPSGATDKDWLGIIIDHTETIYGAKSRSGPASFTGTALVITLGSQASGAMYVADKGAGAWLQWSGENQYRLFLTRDEGDSACANIDFAASRATYSSGTFLSGGATHIVPPDICVCCEDKKLGIVELSHIFTANANVTMTSRLAINITVTPQSSCP